MFYIPKQGHGLPHNPFNAIVAPRPIGWISTRSSHGDNLAPYSFFNAVAYDPPQVIFAGDLKDSIKNVQEKGVFAVNVVSRAVMDVMNQTSAHLPHGIDEFARADVAKAQCTTIDCPRVANAPATLECRMTQIITLEGGADFLVVGTVTGVHIADGCLTNGRFDPAVFGQMGRMGYFDYVEVRDTIRLRRPD